ncbi:four-carbon acid sugar kinase family protein [Gilliamella sp. B3464]|uniref:D-threonate kinase n=1 Tax=unclassified Gilliamella TaxID=2685620 RepID=UPI00226ADDBA|nr:MULTISPECIES: four-carbon acid sugar kinase family protein [unclassified Gilliamella]MCX8711545.1 four-carbon acid sugar kinase family protein [Gilliamella sp. B3468]MCX8726309.1 four-carbon acid sugar kinase family protein [Gilliamella sp. B2838]MCX8738248.1 four-carbon acid sugar kinase family protein [Gilliamella sp. B2824]MCX8750554.1 four-carbon acid sugar kinase family protein [Gilliamella sp. B3464]
MIKLIIADDFTGSNDAGVQLVNKGLVVNVVFDWEKANLSKKYGIQEIKNDNHEVMVVNTESRAVSNEEAKKRIQTVITNNPNLKQIYKKIDSTLRGNIGTEIAALLDNIKNKVALVIPAFPNMNRTTINGNCYINGIELVKTEFASDPKTPIYSSNIKACIEQQTNHSCDEIYLDKVRSGVLKQHIENAINNEKKIIVIDAETNDDLQHIVEQILPLQDKLLLVGSAGLIDFLPIHHHEKRSTKLKSSTHPLLVIAGSMSEKTQQQINYTAKHKDNLIIFDINVADLLSNISLSKLSQLAKEIQSQLDCQKHCIVRTSSNIAERYKVEDYCQEYNLTREQLGEQICQSLGLLVKQLQFENLFLTGGDVAIAVAKSLGAIGFRIEGQVSLGVPYGQLISNKLLSYRVFTKAGGFGSNDIFLRTLEFI